MDMLIPTRPFLFETRFCSEKGESRVENQEADGAIGEGPDDIIWSRRTLGPVQGSCRGTLMRVERTSSARLGVVYRV